MYLAKRLACSVIYQIDEIFIAAGDRERDARTHTHTHTGETPSSYHSTPVSEDPFGFTIGKCANRVPPSVAHAWHRDAGGDAALISFRLFSFYYTASPRAY